MHGFLKPDKSKTLIRWFNRKMFIFQTRFGGQLAL